MTCIAALIHDGQVWMGADSAGVAGLNLTVRDDAKVFKNGEFMMGFTSSFRMGQLLHHVFSPPQRAEGTSDETYMVSSFIDAVRSCLKTGGYAITSNSQESGGTFLVGYRGKLWSVEDDYQVGLSRVGYAAVGCGANIALGTLYATGDRTPRDRLLTALSAAEAHSAGVRRPFRLLHSNDSEHVEVVE